MARRAGCASSSRSGPAAAVPGRWWPPSRGRRRAGTRRARRPRRRRRGSGRPRGRPRGSPGVRPRTHGSCPTDSGGDGVGHPHPPPETSWAGAAPRRRGFPCRLRARVSIREVWLPRTTVRPRPSRSRPLGTCASRNSSRSTKVRIARLPPPTCPPSRMSAETPAMRRSPRAGPRRLRPQTPRYACQFGRLASTSSVGAWTPCVASSAVVDALGSGPRRRPNTPASPTARRPPNWGRPRIQSVSACTRRRCARAHRPLGSARLWRSATASPLIICVVSVQPLRNGYAAGVPVQELRPARPKPRPNRWAAAVAEFEALDVELPRGRGSGAVVSPRPRLARRGGQEG